MTLAEAPQQSWMGSLSPKAREKLKALSDEEAAVLIYEWERWARPNQLPPSGDWDGWLVLGGRGGGKTRTATEWVRANVESGTAKRIPNCILELAPAKVRLRARAASGARGYAWRLGVRCGRKQNAALSGGELIRFAEFSVTSAAEWSLCHKSSSNGAGSRYNESGYQLVPMQPPTAGTIHEIGAGAS